MSDRRSNGSQSELVYVPEPSWYPPLFAAGLAGVVVSLFTWWPYGAIGAVVAIVSLIAMIRAAREDFDRLPRRQRITSAAIPPTPLRRPDRRSGE